MEKKTYLDLKKFLETLTEDQLNQELVVDWVDSHSTRDVSFGIVDEDMYMYDNDVEDSGTLKILKECHEEDFDETLCELITPKGTVFITCD